MAAHDRLTAERPTAAGTPPKGENRNREKKVRPRPQRQVLGWREWIALPQLGISGVKAKVDTGARSSSLHAEDIEILGSGKSRLVRFRLGDPGKLYTRFNAPLEVPLLEERWITSSNGNRQRRPVIRTQVSLAGSLWMVDLSLTRRADMGFPMLLGREAIRGRFMVEPGRSFLAKEHLPKGGQRADNDPSGRDAEERDR